MCAHAREDSTGDETAKQAINLLESSYERCLEYELRKQGWSVQRQVPVPLTYEEVQLDCGYRVDLIVDRDIIVEVKSIDALKGIHSAQMLTYMRPTDARHGLLMNFNCETLKKGLKRHVYKLIPGDFPCQLARFLRAVCGRIRARAGLGFAAPRRAVVARAGVFT